ncbi:hypothetical protein ACJJIU_04190 [Microbulbifer sp. CnH-101-E]|uniref:hypothetical protein n=1 Tax=unclassified Microbulbifer TaxID=2619833 RepID=UPI0040396277
MNSRQENPVVQSDSLKKAAQHAVVRRERDIDTETLSRLAAARQRAVVAKKSYYRDSPGWLVFTGACASLLLLLFWPVSSEQAATELLSATDWYLYEEMDVEMVEDMEFYQWLADELNGQSS